MDLRVRIVNEELCKCINELHGLTAEHESGDESNENSLAADRVTLRAMAALSKEILSTAQGLPAQIMEFGALLENGFTQSQTFAYQTILSQSNNTWFQFREMGECIQNVLDSIADPEKIEVLYRFVRYIAKGTNGIYRGSQWGGYIANLKRALSDIPDLVRDIALANSVEINTKNRLYWERVDEAKLKMEAIESSINDIFSGNYQILSCLNSLSLGKSPS